MNRRRFLSIVASAAALPALPHEAAAAPPLVWRGVSMGASASMMLVLEDRAQGLRLIDRCLAEIDRLEEIFSLYRPGSALNRLNTQGFLNEPPVELVEVLSLGLALARDTQGAFDPSVQPLYRLYAGHFARPGASGMGPSPDRIAAAKALVDYRQIELESARIAFGQPGMAATLNAIAQGYVTDRVAFLLRAEGLENVLLDLGEIVALGHNPEGRAWRATIADARSGDSPFGVELQERRGLPALATSAGSGTRFEGSGRFHHLLDPHTGTSSHHHASVSVAAPSAALADALSTALYLLPMERADDLVSKYAPAAAYFADTNGHISYRETLL